MRDILHWLNEALATKDLVTGMTYYRVQGGEIRATDGRITACHPWPYEGEFLVPGDEFEKLLSRLPGTPTLEVTEDGLKVRSGRFSGVIQTLPLTSWDHPGIDHKTWRPLPKALLSLIKVLRPFISDNAVQPWAMTVALENGWAYATNNVAIAGAAVPGIGKIQALLPVWAIDFILGREHGLTGWTWTDNYVAFRWQTKAWMRAQLAVGSFPDKAASMIRAAWNEKPTQVITPEFRAAFDRVAGLAEDTIYLYEDRIESRFGKAAVEEGIACEVPEGMEASVWGASYLLPALAAATHWSPGAWPKPAVFRGDLVSGYVMGRRA